MFGLTRNDFLVIFLTAVLVLTAFIFSLATAERVITQFNPLYSPVTQMLLTSDFTLQFFSSYLLTTVMILSFNALGFLVYFWGIRKQQNNLNPEDTLDRFNFEINFNYKIILCIAVVVFVAIQTYQHFRYNLPIGTDARIYIYWLETVSQGAAQLGLWRLINLAPTILTFSAIFPFRFAGLSWDVIIKFVPFMLGTLYLLTTFYFVKKNTHNLKLSSFAVLFAALSLHTLTLSTVLFKNLLSLSLLLLFFTFYLRYLSTKKKILIPLCSLLLLFICLQHATTAIFLTITLVLFNITKIIHNSKNGLHTLKNTLKMYIPIPIVIILLDLFNFCLYGKLENPVMAYIPSLIEGNFSFSSLSPVIWITVFQQFWQKIFLENAFLLIFFIIGIIALLRFVTRANEKQFNFTNLLLCWTICVSFMMCITNLEDTYRFVLFYPLPVIATIGLFYVSSNVSPYLKRNMSPFFTKIGHLSRVWKPLIKYLALVSLCLLLLNGAFVRLNSNRYFTPYSLPSNEVEALQWIKDEYSSQKTIFIMKPFGWSTNESLPHYWQWATYYLLPEVSNISIYVGDLSGLFSGIPSQKLPALMETTSYSKELLNEYTVVLIDTQTVGTYYYRDIVEESILVQVHPFIYEVKSLSLQEMESWNASWTNFMETGQITPTEIAFEDSSFDSEWISYHGSLITDNSVAQLTLDNDQTDMWIIRHGLSINSSKYNLMGIQADPHGGLMAIDFYGYEGEVLGRYWQLKSWNGSQTIYLKLDEIISGTTISHIAINFLSKNEATSCNIYYVSIFNL